MADDAALRAELDATRDELARALTKLDDERQERWRRAALVYPAILPTLKGVAHEHGYAVAVHGTQQRDLDLIAVPWTGGALAPTVLVDALCAVIGEVYNPPERRVPERKPHGRLAWALQLGGGLYVDLSVIPPAGLLDAVAQAAEEWAAAWDALASLCRQHEHNGDLTEDELAAMQAADARDAAAHDALHAAVRARRVAEGRGTT